MRNGVFGETTLTPGARLYIPICPATSADASNRQPATGFRNLRETSLIETSRGAEPHLPGPEPMAHDLTTDPMVS